VPPRPPGAAARAANPPGGGGPGRAPVTGPSGLAPTESLAMPSCPRPRAAAAARPARSGGGRGRSGRTTCRSPGRTSATSHVASWPASPRPATLAPPASAAPGGALRGRPYGGLSSSPTSPRPG